MVEAKLLRRVQQQFKLRGLGLRMDAVGAVADFAADYHGGEEDAIEQILSALERKTLKTSIVTKDVIEEVAATLCGTSDAGESTFHVVDAFDVPHWTYDSIHKTFHPVHARPSLFGEATAKTELYRERLLLLQQRILRNRLFTKPALSVGRGDAQSHCELTPLQSLVGSLGVKYVMGTISQLEDGRFFLEDLNATVPLDLTGAATTSGLFTENSIVVAEGELQPTGVFQVHALGFPPLESKEASQAACMNADFFGAPVIPAEDVAKLQERERSATTDMFVFLSDIWVDSQESMARLKQVLEGYESVDVVPSLFVFIGNFWSNPSTLANYDFASMRLQFRALGTLIASFPRIKEGSRLIFVPGPGDPGPVNALPRPALPKLFTKELAGLLPDAIFASNPCRIRFCTQDIVVFRADLLHSMRRCCVLPPSEDETQEPFDHLAVTLLQQSHLCPLPISIQSILWEYDHALRLYPVPDVLVLADRAEQKEFTFENVVCFNPGSFANDSTFAAYRPATREAELSAL